MIVGEDFIWLHLPKTGGASTRSFLNRILKDKVVSYTDDHYNDDGLNAAHYSLSQARQADALFSTDDKRIMCGIRRLPHWLLSNIYYHISHNRDFGVKRDNLNKGQFKTDENKNWVSADQRLMTFELKLVDQWIRLENLSDDLCKAFQGLKCENDIKTSIAADLRLKNKTEIPYIKRVDFWWTQDELQQLYAANPVWAALEKRIYGSLLS